MICCRRHLPVIFLVATLIGFIASPAFAQNIDIPHEQIERGIHVYGKANPYAELKTRQTFAVSPDGETIVSVDFGLQRFDPESQSFEGDRDPQKRFATVEFSSDGEFIFALRGQQTRRFWSSGKLETTGPKEGDRSRLVVFDAETLTELDSFEFDNGGLVGMTISPSGKLAALHDNRSLIVVDTSNGETVLEPVPAFTSTKHANAAFLENETKLAFVDLRTDVAIVNLENGDSLNRRDSSIVGLSAEHLSADRDGKLIAIGQNPGVIKLFDTATDSVRATARVKSGQNYLTRITVTPDGSLVAAAFYSNDDGTWAIKTFDSSGKNADEFEGYTGHTMQFAGEPRLLFAFGFNVGLVKISLSGEHPTEAAWRGSITKFSVAPKLTDHALLVTNSQIVRMNLATMQLESQEISNYRQGELMTDKSYFWPASRNASNLLKRSHVVDGVTKNESFLLGTNGAVTQSPLQAVRGFLDGDSSKPKFRQYSYMAMSRSPDGQHVYVAFFVKTVQWSQPPTVCSLNVIIQKRKLDGTVVEQTEVTNEDLGVPNNTQDMDPFFGFTYAVSPNGNQVVFGNQLIDTESLNIIYDWKKQNIQKLAYSPDGRWLAATNRFKVSLIDTQTGEVVHSIDRLNQPMMAFSPDSSKFVVAASEKGDAIRILETDSWTSTFSRGGTQHDRTAIGILGDRLLIGLKDNRLEVWDLSLLNK
ncbi:MAG: hypothetical protein AAFN77_07055 [Planctomycetota bacterium]